MIHKMCFITFYQCILNRYIITNLDRYVIIVYWRDIPAQVIVGKGRRATKIQLSERFEQAIDRAAMKSDQKSTDDYLAEWRKAKPFKAEGNPENIAKEQAEKLEAEYDKEKLIVLVNNNGRAT